MTVKSHETIPILLIGTGQYSSVYANGDIRSDSCVKQMPLTNGKSSAASARRKAVSRELCVLRLLRDTEAHHVVRFEGASVLAGNIYIRMERMAFSLDDFVTAVDTRIDESVIVSLARGLAQGIKACHDLGIVHRDVKPGNVLLGQDGSIKLCDFGLCRKVSSSDSELTACTNQVCSRWYKAVEVLLGNGNQSFAMDLWSLGCIAAELYMLSPIFQGWSDLEQLCIIQSVLGSLDQFSSATPTSPSPCGLRAVTPSGMSDNCLEFITKCFEYDPKQRWSVSEAVNSSWLTESQEHNMDQAHLASYFRGINSSWQHIAPSLS